MEAENNFFKTCQTPLDELKKDALAHYKEASTAIHHWSSFIPAAIKAYNPKPKEDAEIWNEMINEISGLTYKYLGESFQVSNIELIGMLQKNFTITRK